LLPVVVTKTEFRVEQLHYVRSKRVKAKELINDG